MENNAIKNFLYKIRNIRITQVLQNLKLNTQVKTKTLEKIVEIVTKENIKKLNAKAITIIFRY